jgi:tRNA-splicing ligase RtcB
MLRAGAYAYAGRDWVCNRVLKILDSVEMDAVHNHHNYAWLEPHFGEMYYVVRKGATPAFPYQYGFVGGSMGDQSVILRGIPTAPGDSDAENERALALYSTIHGAGRVRGRQDAIRGPVVGHDEKGRAIRDPAQRVTAEDLTEWLDTFGIINGYPIALRGGGVDEAPQVYKRLRDVLKAHAKTVNVVKQLIPIGVAMAGRDVKDPYKD